MMSSTLPASMADAERRFRAATPRSAQMAEEARRYFPGGVGRAGMPVMLYPVFIERGEGQYLFDIDGNRMLDLSNGHSALPVGHAHPAMVEAVNRQTARGLGFALMQEHEIKLAAMLQARVPSMELLRFTASGTEATMFAIRLARAFTGRTLFARMEGSYHGLHDMMMSGMGASIGPSWRNTDNDPVANGVLPEIRDGVVYLPFNDLAACEAAIAEHAADLAALIVEPFMGSGGGLPGDRAFLHGLRAACDRHGVLLVFDEMISIGLAPGGAQEYYGVRADLTASGKLVGGGMPMGVFGGRADIMSLMEGKDGRQPQFMHTGTWNGHPISMVAGIAQLELLGADQYAYLGEIGDTMRAKVRALAARKGVALQVSGIQHFSGFHYTDRPVRNRRDVLRADQDLAAKVAFSLLSQGFYLVGGRSNLSTAITHDDIDAFVAALAIAFDESGASGGSELP